MKLIKDRKDRVIIVTVILVMLVIGAVMNLHGEIKTNDFSYNHDGVELQGLFAYDDAVKGTRPGVLIIHEWTGLGDYVKERAMQLASGEELHWNLPEAAPMIPLYQKSR
jgi:hypothetical protein